MAESDGNLERLKMAGYVGLLVVIMLLRLLPRAADYNNLALQPELAEKIGASLPTQILLSDIGRSLLDSLSGRSGPALPAGKIRDESARNSLDRFGKRVMEVLDGRQRMAFAFFRPVN